MNRRSFILSGLALAAFGGSASANHNSWGRVPAWGGSPVWGRGPTWGGGAPNWGGGFTQSRPSNYKGRQTLSYQTKERPGTIIIDTSQRWLYLVLPGGKAIRYGVGVGRDGFNWSGVARVAMKRQWPEWRPPAEMIQRELVQYNRQLPEVMPGGLSNPLGARALYLFQGDRDTLYRIHGTNQPHTIRQAVSSGCIRMLNEEVIELYDKVPIGAKVIVL
jgi:lipoprotein-anchoring transpeptidase ErfK/SrfK